MKEGELADSSSSNLKGDGPSSLSLVRKQFGGKYAISAEEFTPEMVRLAKSDSPPKLYFVLHSFLTYKVTMRLNIESFKALCIL